MNTEQELEQKLEDAVWAAHSLFEREKLPVLPPI